MSEPPTYYTADQVETLIHQRLAELQAGQAQGSVSMDQVQGLINAALAQQAEAHDKAIQALASSMRGAVVTFIPEHAGGPGTEIAETWSEFDRQKQLAARETALAAA